MKDNVSNFFYTPAQYWINKIYVQTKKVMYLSDWIFFFQSKCNKAAIELYVAKVWSKIILVISNQIRATRSLYFKNMRMISDQIALHSIQ